MAYNGWKNYETWIVDMWLDGNYTGEGTYHATLELVESIRETYPDFEPTYQLADALKGYVEESLADLGASLEADLLGAAMSEVDWQELAEAQLSAFSE